MKKNKTAKVFAIFALLGIVVSIIGTGILVLMTPSQQPELSIESLQDIIDNTKIEVGTEKTLEK